MSPFWPLRDARLALWMRRAQGGDREAFRALYRALHPVVSRFVALRVFNRADAEDLVSQVFFRLLDSLPAYTSARAPVLTWALAIARNAVTNSPRMGTRCASTWSKTRRNKSPPNVIDLYRQRLYGRNGGFCKTFALESPMANDIKSVPNVVVTKLVSGASGTDEATAAPAKEHGLKIFTLPKAGAPSATGSPGKSTFSNAPDKPAFPVTMSYFGGKVLSAPVVVPVYMGDYFKSKDGKVFRDSNDAAVATMVQDPGFTSVWAEYGVGPGKTEPSHVVSGAYEAGRVVSDQEIQGMLLDKVNSGEFSPKDSYAAGPKESWEDIARKLIVKGVMGVDDKKAVEVLKKMNPTAGDDPAGQTILVPGKRNSSAIYTVVLPPEVILYAGGGVDSTVGLGGFHSNIHDAQGNPVYYAAIAAGTADNGIPFTTSALKNTTITESHEISEAATDPDIGDAAVANDWTKVGWIDPFNGEIGDIEVNDAAPGTPLGSMYGQTDGSDISNVAMQKIFGKDEGLNEISTPHVGAPPEALPPPTNINTIAGNGAVKNDVTPK